MALYEEESSRHSVVADSIELAKMFKRQTHKCQGMYKTFANDGGSRSSKLLAPNLCDPAN